MKTQICLNMIVKNEAKIITRCLKSVAPYISTWIIHDTGSTDNTPAVIRDYFASVGKPGRVVENCEFKNFEHSRNAALKDAMNEDVDYILLLDADMQLCVQGSLEDFDKTLTDPVYKLCQKNHCLSYFNTRLVGRVLFNLSQYYGVTHEYIGTGPLAVTRMPDPIAYIFDHADGGCKADKFIRDKLLLEQDTRESPTNSRSWFYLGQTYKDLGEWENALKTYEHYGTLSGWEEELWYSKYMIVKCHIALGNKAEALQAGVEAYQLRPHRSEPLYLLTKLCRDNSWNHFAWQFGVMGLSIPFPTQDSLFVESAIYSHKFLYEMSIVAYYLGKKREGLVISNHLLLTSQRRVGLDANTITSIQQNLSFYIQPLSGAVHTELTLGIEKGWNCMNPSICDHGGELHLNIRAVNYLVDRKLSYSLNEGHPRTGITAENPIRTRNFSGKWEDGKVTALGEFIPEDKHLPHYPNVCLGYEDVRIFEYNEEMWFVATVRELSVDGINTMVLGTKSGKKLFKLKSPVPNRCEKNWLPFQHEGKLLIIYQYSPLTILEVDTERGEYTTRSKMLCQPLTLGGFRGGSAPAPYKDGYLFAVHEVLPDYSATRHYIHRFIRLSRDLKITHISEPKHIRGVEPIEYVSGMVIRDEVAYITWGEMDGKAYLTTVSVTELISDNDEVGKVTSGISL